MDVEKATRQLAASVEVHESLSRLVPAVVQAAEACAGAIRAGNKLIFFGNGGSAADAQHLACEVVVKFNVDRRAIPAVALTANTSTLTAAANDYGFEKIFSRQLEALAAEGDVVIAISTSGESPNVLNAVDTAREKGCVVIALTGSRGRRLAYASDIAIQVESDETPRIQEAHITIGHVICGLVEDAVCGESGA